MIGSNPIVGRDLTAGFREVANVDHLSKIKIDEFDDLAISANIERFPGLILAWPRASEQTIYYAITSSSAEWRRLHPLLLAYAGPTLTDFTGIPEPLDATIALENFLLVGNWYKVVRLTPGNDARIQKMTHRSLKRLIETITIAPNTSQAAPLPTSRLISKLFNSLNGHNLEEAQKILNVLRQELRVDALNLAFLEVQIYSHFGDWRSIFEMPSFISLTRTRRPPSVTAALLETLYQTYLANAEAESSFDEIRQQYLEELRPLASPMLRIPPPINLGPGGWHIYAWEAICSKDNKSALLELCLANTSSFGSKLTTALEALQEEKGSETLVRTPFADSPIVRAKEALTVAIEVDSLTAIKRALDGIKSLNQDQRQELLASEPFHSIWRAINAEITEDAVSENWLVWLENAEKPQFTNSINIARRGLGEWSIDVLKVPDFIENLAQKLTRFSDKPPEYDRLIEALPILVAWVLKDPLYPRLQMMATYEAILYHILASSRNGIEALESGTELIRGMLSIGVSKNTYKVLLEDALDLIGPSIGTRAFDCVLDLVEETVSSQSPDPEVRQGFWFQIIVRVQAVIRHLTPIQRASLNRLGDGLGWNDNNLDVVNEVRSNSDNDKKAKFIDRLQGRHIGIYTLTEGAARQAESLLKTLVPSARVTLSSEYDGSPILKSMAQGADIVVMVTASATHAATTFIQQHRPRNLPVLYAKGKGCTSILRALEDYTLNTKS